MIAPYLVTLAVLDALRGGPDVVGYLNAPPGPPQRYTVVERPPGDTPAGSIADDEASILYRLRVRTVSTVGGVESAGLEAEAAALRHRDRLRAPVAGFGFEVVHCERIASSGVMHEGPAANVVDDYELLVVASTASALP